MAHAHLLSDHEPAAKPTDAVPASAAQIFLLIELVRPISALAELILARHAAEDAPAPAAPPPAAKSKKGSVAAALDAMESLDGDE